MEKEQALEWAKAQDIAVSLDLVAAAKQQLHFLAEIDRHRHLYDGPALNRAIYRYKYCWLPLLAKHVKSQVSRGPLVVPLDCEWIWHCHRLNPVQYKNDCKELYGIILGNRNVVSSTQATCKKQTEEIWKITYPKEPYELNINSQITDNGSNKSCTKYDLASAVKRQIPFCYQVLRPYMKDNSFLEEAVARYKGFLYLIKRNQERSISQFCVPTYDIDLIWHAHQLHPISYCKDLVALIGRVLQHDDTDSDRSEGKKLDTGFTRTTEQWEETFGTRYWRAGAMYRGSAPSPLTINASELNTVNNTAVEHKEYQSIIKFHNRTFVEVMLEIIGIRGLPTGENGNYLLTFSKNQTDNFFSGKRRLILSESGEKRVAVFQCEPIGDLVLDLVSYSPGFLDAESPPKVLGTTSIPLQDLTKPGCYLSLEKWFKFQTNTLPVNLRIALSFTPPVPAPFMLQLKSNCLGPTRSFQHGKGWTCVVDETGKEIMCLKIRDSMKVEANKVSRPTKEMICTTPSGETHVIGESAGTGWSLINSGWWFQLMRKSDISGPVFQFTGHRKLAIFPGRKLEYEVPNLEEHKEEQNLMTAVEFSAEYPSGKAVALFNLKSGCLQIKEEWLLLPGILLAFLLSNSLEKEVDFDLSTAREKENASKQVLSEIDCDFSFESDGCGFCGAVNGDKIMAERGMEDASFESNKSRHCSAVHGIGLYGVDSALRDMKSSVPGGSGLCSNCGGGGCIGICTILKDEIKSSRCGGCGGCGGGGCSSCGGSACAVGSEGGGCRGSCRHDALNGSI